MKTFHVIFGLLLFFPSLQAMRGQQNTVRPSAKPDVLIIDMETTDLDPVNSKILEISALVIDTGKFEIEVKKEVYGLISHRANVLDDINPLLRQRIIDSGLPERWQILRPCSLQEASSKILDALGEQQPSQHLPVLAGNSQVKLHQHFLRIHLPQVYKRLALKEPINIPSIRTFIKIFNPNDILYPVTSDLSSERVQLLFEEFKYYKRHYLNDNIGSPWNNDKKFDFGDYWHDE